MPNSPCNLVSLVQMNNSKIFYYNKNKTFYDLKTQKILVHAQRWRNSYFFKPLNLSYSTVMLICIDDKIYQYLLSIYVTNLNKKLLFLTWHKRLSHFNLYILKQYLKKLKTDYIDDFNGYTYNNY